MTNDWINMYTQHKPHPHFCKLVTSKWSAISAAQSAGQSMEYLTCQLSCTTSICTFKSPKTEKNEAFVNSLKVNHTRGKLVEEKSVDTEKKCVKRCKTAWNLYYYAEYVSPLMLNLKQFSKSTKTYPQIWLNVKLKYMLLFPTCKMK